MSEAVLATLVQFVADHSRGVFIFGGFCLYVLFLFSWMCWEEGKTERKLLEKRKDKSEPKARGITTGLSTHILFLLAE